MRDLALCSTCSLRQCRYTLLHLQREGEEGGREGGREVFLQGGGSSFPWSSVPALHSTTLLLVPSLAFSLRSKRRACGFVACRHLWRLWRIVPQPGVLEPVPLLGSISPSHLHLLYRSSPPFQPSRSSHSFLRRNCEVGSCKVGFCRHSGSQFRERTGRGRPCAVVS